VKVEFDQLASIVRTELESYAPPQLRPGALGEPLPASWFETKLAEMRRSLVDPYWTDIRDEDSASRKLVVLKVAVVADDGAGSLVAFDPRGEGEFVLAQRDADPDAARGVGIVSCGVRGDVVGCFLAR
jgi:hypothetical protein